MKLDNLIRQLEVDWEQNGKGSVTVTHDVIHATLSYLLSIQMLDMRGRTTSDTIRTSYGVLNVQRVLFHLGWNDNPTDEGVEDHTEKLAGHLQTAFEAGRDAERAAQSKERNDE